MTIAPDLAPPETLPAVPGPTEIWTGSGYLDLTSPDPAQLRREDIARALSHQARFNGLTLRPYSVAEHSLSCARIAGRLGADPEGMRAALWHDAAEAYLGDVVSPLKGLVTGYAARERELLSLIFARFDVAFPFPEDMVRRADALAISAEKGLLFPDAGPWPCDFVTGPRPAPLSWANPAEAAAAWLRADDALRNDDVPGLLL